MVHALFLTFLMIWVWLGLLKMPVRFLSGSYWVDLAFIFCQTSVPVLKKLNCLWRHQRQISLRRQYEVYLIWQVLSHILCENLWDLTLSFLYFSVCDSRSRSMALPSSGSSVSASSVPKLCSICAMSLTVTAKLSIACGGRKKRTYTKYSAVLICVILLQCDSSRLAAYCS